MNSFYDEYLQKIHKGGGSRFTGDDLMHAYKAGMLRAAEIAQKYDGKLFHYAPGEIVKEAESIK